MDRISPSVEIILERIEMETDYEVPTFGRAEDVAQVAEAGVGEGQD
jgi:hypothetical protein